jgi:hypothetical protein
MGNRAATSQQASLESSFHPLRPKPSGQRYMAVAMGNRAAASQKASLESGFHPFRPKPSGQDYRLLANTIHLRS